MPNNGLWCTVALFLILVSQWGAASEHALADIPATTIVSLASEKTWRLLLGYNSSQTSSITSGDYFLAADGASNPKAELMATLKHLAMPAGDSTDTYAQCQYRGRYVWLRNKLDLNNKGLEIIDCPEYRKFSSDGKFHSVSLIFATGYLGNPASYYGHLLLKINTDTKTKSNIEDIAVNYGARIPDNENMLAYVIKGMTGSYTSTFTPKEFYYHMHNYSDGEMRDLWEYELNLDSSAYELLVAHTWEILGQTHDYYFLNRNCAYRMAELIELVTDEPMTKGHLPWEAPQSILQRLTSATNNGKKIIKTVNYRPSRQSKLYKKYAQLNVLERNQIERVINNINHFQSPKFKALDERSTIKILDTLLDYYRFISPKKKYFDSKEYNATLAQRFLLPTGKPSFKLESDNNPHLGHSPSYTSIGVIDNKNHGRGITVRMRPAYYDTLDAGFGHIRGASLSMMDMAFTHYDSKTSIDYINLLAIENLNTHSTQLPGDKQYAWNLLIAAQKMDNKCIDCLGYMASIGRGYTSMLIQDRLSLNAMVNIGLKEEKIIGDALHSDLSLRVNYEINDKLKLMARATQREYVNTGRGKTRTDLSLRYEISNNLDFRVTINKNKTTEAYAGVGFYW